MHLNKTQCGASNFTRDQTELCTPTMFEAPSLQNPMQSDKVKLNSAKQFFSAPNKDSPVVLTTDTRLRSTDSIPFFFSLKYRMHILRCLVVDRSVDSSRRIEYFFPCKSFFSSSFKQGATIDRQPRRFIYPKDGGRFDAPKMHVFTHLLRKCFTGKSKVRLRPPKSTIYGGSKWPLFTPKTAWIKIA